jgi:hypothetical protein
MKYAAIGLAILYFIAGGPGIISCAIKGCQPGGGKMFLIGVVTVLLYFPLYWWRKSEDRRLGTDEYKVAAPVA